MNKGFLLKLGSITLFSMLGFIQIVHAWSDANGIPVSAVTGSQYVAQAISDGQGGAIITWMDRRVGADIYAQSITSTGNVRWTMNGIAICTTHANHWFPQIISDNQGGAIIAWMDYRSDGYGVSAQSIDSSGAIKWALNGISVSTVSNPSYPQLVTDGQGGAIITWRNYLDGSIMAQSITSDGTLKWDLNGVVISTTSNQYCKPKLVSDEHGGAIITWSICPWNSQTYTDIYAQAIDSTGHIKWAENGVTVCSDSGDQYSPQIAYDGQGGASIAWLDNRNGNICVQAIGSTGAKKWSSGAKIIGQGFMGDYYGDDLLKMFSDNHGGAIIAWNKFDVYVQSISSTGAFRWGDNGIDVGPFNVSNGITHYINLVPYDDGGTIICWDNTHISAQLVNCDGSVSRPGGVLICPDYANPRYPALVADAKGNAIVIWSDNRNGTDTDLFAHYISQAQLTTDVGQWEIFE